MKKWQERRANRSILSRGEELTARMFLGKDGHSPYVTPEQILFFNDNGREEDINEMSSFVDLVNGKHKIIVTRKTHVDKGNNPYKFQNFIRIGGVSDGAKVVLIGNIAQFIQDLYDSKFVINFTYDDLIEEAEQA